MLKKKLFKLFFALFSVLIIGLPACKNMDTFNKSIKIPFNPSSGSTYNFEIVNERKIEQEVEGRKMVSPYTSIINLSYDIMQVPSHNFVITVGLDSFNVKPENKKFDTKILPSDTLHSSFKTMLDALKGTLFKLEVESTGKIKEINGYETFKRKVDSLNNYVSSNHDSELSSPLNIFNKTYFRNLFETILIPLPDVPTSKNSPWISFDSTGMDEPIKFTSVYTLTKVENGIAYIKTSSDIDQEIKIINKYSVRMKGIQQGEIRVEESTGMLLQKESNLKMRGNLKFNKMDILLSVTINQKIKGRKL